MLAQRFYTLSKPVIPGNYQAAFSKADANIAVIFDINAAVIDNLHFQCKI